jgi:regulator of cell morphogenesis and NO signaling
MFLQSGKIETDSFITDIVMSDYRTASIFRKYEIEYCCGGKWPLSLICETRGLDINMLMDELHNATRTIHVPNSLQFADWSIDFLVEYIVNVHHNYLKNMMDSMRMQLKNFTREHAAEYPDLAEVDKIFHQLATELLPHLIEEEEIIFPYIRHIAHAYNDNDSYGNLLVRTMRKPLEAFMEKEHSFTGKQLTRMRELTQNYEPPKNACIQHRVIFSVLKDLDNDLAQHLHLENNILFPKAVAMEKELLK